MAKESAMEIDHLPGKDGVVRFPVERRAKPTLMLAEELAPRQDLADAMADERANGEGRPDTLATVVEAFTSLAEALEFSMGVEASLAHLRAMNEVQVERACTLGWASRDAGTCQRLWYSRVWNLGLDSRGGCAALD